MFYSLNSSLKPTYWPYGSGNLSLIRHMQQLVVTRLFARSKFAMVPQHKLAISGVPIGPIPISNLWHGQNVLSVHSLARARTVSFRIKSYLLKKTPLSVTLSQKKKIVPPAISRSYI